MINNASKRARKKRPPGMPRRTAQMYSAHTHTHTFMRIYANKTNYLHFRAIWVFVCKVGIHGTCYKCYKASSASSFTQQWTHAEAVCNVWWPDEIQFTLFPPSSSPFSKQIVQILFIRPCVRVCVCARRLASRCYCLHHTKIVHNYVRVHGGRRAVWFGEQQMYVRQTR